jgi:DNA-directed RNA polymerase subunit M/transcription elongation factor TFIIS
MPIHAVRLQTKGEVGGAMLNPEGGLLQLEDAQAYFGKKTPPFIIGHYNYKDMLIVVIGYNKGKAGTENRCSLAKPYEKTVLYGDALVVGTKNKKPTAPIQLTPFTVTEYKGLAEEIAGRGTISAAAPVELTTAVDDDEDELPEFDEEDGDDVASDGDSDSDSGSDRESVPEEEEEEAPAPKRKKKVVQTQLLSGYQKQSQLLIQEGDNELKEGSNADVEPRKSCLARFIFLANQGLTEADVVELERQIFIMALEEAGKKRIFAHWKNPLFQEIHNFRQFRLFSNLHPKSPVGNARLMKRVLEKELSMHDLARLDDMELYPENWKTLQDQQLVREQKLLEGNKMAATDMFKCNRCGKRETTYYEMQTRSADEPMTIFITCINCGKKWKQ